MADVFNEKDRTTAHSLPAFRRYQFRAAMCVQYDMLTHDLLRNSNGNRESSCVARCFDGTSVCDETSQRCGAGPLTRSRKRASLSRIPTRVALSPAAMLTRCCTVSMSSDVGIDRATTSSLLSDGTTMRSCTS